MLLRLVMGAKAFTKWGIDFVGPIDHPLIGHKPNILLWLPNIWQNGSREGLQDTMTLKQPSNFSMRRSFVIWTNNRISQWSWNSLLKWCDSYITWQILNHSQCVCTIPPSSKRSIKKHQQNVVHCHHKTYHYHKVWLGNTSTISSLGI